MEQIKQYVDAMQRKCIDEDFISKNLYSEFNVKRGLRDENGKGILTGLTNISQIRAFENKGGLQIPCNGELLYRGYDIRDLVDGGTIGRFLYEEGTYLLLFGELPTVGQLQEFQKILSDCMTLPINFTRDVIMKAPSPDIMNSITRSILTLASYDENANDTSIPNVLRQSIQLIAEFPMLAAYAFHTHNHYNNGHSMFIHHPDTNLSISENILRMLRPDMKYTDLESKVLDVALLLHMEHGGGNNSTFTTRVVTSSGSDTYSAIAAAMSSLKGPKHGGANLKVINMMDDIRKNVQDHDDFDELKDYLGKILDGETFDHQGLIYGILNKVINIKASGHACSMTSPIIFLSCFIKWYWVFPGMALWCIVAISSVWMERHNWKQLAIGTVTCLVATLIAFIIY